jgi:hypothetical protein
MSQPARIATTVLASAAVLAGSYALYFDYQRRNNPEFRKQIRMSPLLSHLNLRWRLMIQDYRRKKPRLRRKEQRRN